MSRGFLTLSVVMLATVVCAPAAGAAALRPAPTAPPSYARATEQVKRQGWSCVAVKGDRAGNGFAYTVGLSSKHLPELGVFGTADPATACGAIDRVARAGCALRSARQKRTSR